MTRCSPENGYPADWPEISLAIRERSGGRCECRGECGLHHEHRCTEQNRQPAEFARGKIVLTVAHLDHTPSNCDPSNLKAMCQRCHLRYDGEQHRRSAFETRMAKKGRPMFQSGADHE